MTHNIYTILLRAIVAITLAAVANGQITGNQVIGVIPNYYQPQYQPAVNLVPINYEYRQRPQTITRITTNLNQDGRYRPEQHTGRYIHDNSGRYVHDNSGEYDHTDKLAGHYDHTDRLKGIYDHTDRLKGQYDSRLHQGQQDQFAGLNVAYQGQTGLHLLDHNQLGGAGIVVTSTPAPAVTVHHAVLGGVDGSLGQYHLLHQGVIGNEIGAAASKSETRVGSGNLFGADAQQRFSNNYWRILKYANDKYEDGYHYLYETENGINAEEEGHLENKGTDQEAMRAEGYFSYTGPDNVVYTVRYVADKNGFNPVGDHLPTPPPIPPQIQRSLDYKRSLGLI